MFLRNVLHPWIESLRPTDPSDLHEPPFLRPPGHAKAFFEKLEKKSRNLDEAFAEHNSKYTAPFQSRPRR